MSKMEQKCRSCYFFEYQIHHESCCNLLNKKGAKELRDGRATACEEWEGFIMIHGYKLPKWEADRIQGDEAYEEICKRLER